MLILALLLQDKRLDEQEAHQPVAPYDATDFPLVMLPPPEIGEKLQILIVKTNAVDAAPSSKGETIA
jgi:hypothetical protein